MRDASLFFFGILCLITSSINFVILMINWNTVFSSCTSLAERTLWLTSALIMLAAVCSSAILIRLCSRDL